MSAKPVDNKSVLDDLVSQLYATTLAPENYDALMEALEALIYEDQAAASGEGLSNHFQTALDILQQMGRRRRRQKREHDAVHNAPNAAYVIDVSGRILAMNDLAKIGYEANTLHLRNLHIEDSVLKRLFLWMENETANWTNVFIEPAMIGAPAQSNCLMARSLMPIEGDVQESIDAPEQHFLLTTVELQFDRVRAERFLIAYDLTKAEMEVAIDLAGGASPGSIAEKRKTSINTVRSQIKSILSKTNTANTPDLVRLLCGFSAGISAITNPAHGSTSSKAASHLKRRSAMTLADGRQLSWLEQGDTNGAPVICIHNMLYGVEWPDAAVEAAARRRIRIISPSRPGFGSSDLAPTVYGDKLLDTVANDIHQLMDHLGIERAIIAGHVMGALYALRFALRHPSRVAALFSISHSVMWRDEWLATRPKRQRLVGYITRDSPHLLPFVLRAGIALIDAGLQRQFIDGLHKDIPADVRALRRSDVYEVVLKGLDHTIQQGGEAFRRDCPLNLTDYSTSALSLEKPFQIIHGDGDKLIPMSNVECFAAMAPGTTIIRVKGAGQYLLFSHWQTVLTAISNAAAEMG